MQRVQAQRLCDEINGLDCEYVADIVPVTSRYDPSHPFGISVKHLPSGNEIGYAGEVDEGRYLVDGIKWRVTA